MLDQLTLDEPQGIDEVLVIDAQARVVAQKQIKHLTTRG